MPTYTLELKLNTKKYSDQCYLENYFREVAKIGNTVRRFAIRQITLLKRDKTYIDLLQQYVALEKGPEKEALSKQLSMIVKSYRLTQYDLQKSATKLRNHLKYVHSDVYQKISDSVWKGAEKVLYSTGKQIHYKKWEIFKFRRQKEYNRDHLQRRKDIHQCISKEIKPWSDTGCDITRKSKLESLVL